MLRESFQLPLALAPQPLALFPHQLQGWARRARAPLESVHNRVDDLYLELARVLGPVPLVIMLSNDAQGLPAQVDLVGWAARSAPRLVPRRHGYSLARQS